MPWTLAEIALGLLVAMLFNAFFDRLSRAEEETKALDDWCPLCAYKRGLAKRGIYSEKEPHDCPEQRAERLDF